MKTNTASSKFLGIAFYCVSLVLPFAAVSCGNHAPVSEIPTKRLTPKVAEEVAPYAMMAENAYRRKDAAPYPVEKLGWTRINPDGTPANPSKPSYSNAFGLALDVYRHEGTGRFAYVFRGTTSKWDYATANAAFTVAGQYKSARKQYRNFVDGQAGGNVSKVVIVGHSLGGGLALSCSVDTGSEAIVFNTSPRVFDGVGDHQKPAKRIAVEQEGEILEKARSVSTKYPEVMKGQSEYFCDGHPKKHRMTLLLEDVLKEAVRNDPRYEEYLSLVRRNQKEP